jgi:hypothetical protein
MGGFERAEDRRWLFLRLGIIFEVEHHSDYSVLNNNSLRAVLHQFIITCIAAQNSWSFYCLITVQYSIAPSSQANNPLAKSNAIKLRIPRLSKKLLLPTPRSRFRFSVFLCIVLPPIRLSRTHKNPVKPYNNGKRHAPGWYDYCGALAESS